MTSTIDVIGNTIDRVTATPGSGDAAIGIEASSARGVIADNHISHLVKDGNDAAYGIYLYSPGRVSVHGNRLSNPEGAVAGVYCDDPTEPGLEHFPGIASDNHFNGFLGGVVGCVDGGDNVVR